MITYMPIFSLSVSAEGLSSSPVRSALVSVQSEFRSGQQLLRDVQDRARVWDRLSSLSSQLKVLEAAVQDAEAWQNRTARQETDAELSALHALRDDCQVSAVTRGAEPAWDYSTRLV